VIFADDTGGVRRTVADHYSRNAERYATFENVRSRAQATPVLDALPLAGATRVLDVGTGPGTLLPELTRRSPRALVVGVDASEGALSRARRDLPHPLAVMDTNRLALTDESFDVVTFSFSLFHLPDPATGLGQAARVLRPGGAVGVVTHDASHPRDPAPATTLVESLLARFGPDVRPIPPFVEAVTEASARELLEAGGFVSVRTWAGGDDVVMDREGAELLARARARAPGIAPGPWSAFEDDVRAALATLAPEDFRTHLAFVYATGVRRPGR
jgi:ubiquinone/menaquinone biosynthesis C-methylase UbiE